MALVEQARVIHALILRDIKTRFGASYLGFFLGLLIPLAHIGIILAVYIFIGRRAPIGTNVTLYLATAIVPFVVWSYTHQKVMHSLAQNRALTAFPIVKLHDIVIARATVELLNAVLIVLVVISAFMIMEVDIFIQNPTYLLYSLILAYLMGVSTGSIFGLLALLAPGFMIIGFVIIPLYWITSGVLFIPDGLPEQARFALAAFPLSHIIDFARTSFYSSYLSNFPNLAYVHAIIIANFLIALAIESFFKTSITSK